MTSIEHRGSPESSGCLTARESELNSDYRGHHDDLSHLAQEYENRLDLHISSGRKGLPVACAVIAARVKTMLSEPVIRISR